MGWFLGNKTQDLLEHFSTKHSTLYFNINDVKLKGWTDILKTKDGELVQFLVGGIIAEIVIAVQDWMTDGYRIRDVLLKILLGLFSFHSLLVFLGFSFDILSAFFLCCLPRKETWFATWESCLSRGFRHRYRIRLVTSLITSILNVKHKVFLYFG